MAVSILLLRATVETALRKGVEREALFRAARLDPRVLEDPEGRIALADYDALHEVVIDLTGDPAFGLHLGETTSSRTHSVAHLVEHAATLRDGIEALLRFYRLFNDRPVWRLVEDHRTATLFYDVAPGPERCKRLRAEMTMTGFFRMIRLFARDARPEYVAFEHAAPPYRAEYTRIFDGVERFEQPFTGIVFDRALLGTVRLLRDPEFHAVIEAHSEKRLSRLTRGSTYADRVREYLLEQPNAESRDMRAAARALGLSVRSLRRKLQKEGAAYSDIADGALATLAKRLLSDERRTIQETAYAMGFSAPSAFHKAFKRWTGTTPKEFRQRRDSDRI